jgi:hypothetical protein
MSEKKTISKSDGLSALKLVLYSLVTEGMSIDEIVDETSSILKQLIDSKNISLLSVSHLGIVKEKHISQIGDLVFDPMKRTICYKGEKAELSPTEQN